MFQAADVPQQVLEARFVLENAVVHRGQAPEGAPQEPQSRPSRESAISSTRAIFSMAEAMSSSSFSTGTYSRGASQSISGVTASMWFRLTGRCFRMR